MVKNMFSILMDGIKDTNMCIDYAIEAVDIESPYATWFKNHAKTRLDSLMNDYGYVSQEIGLHQKAREDEMAQALKCHLDYQMSELKHKFDSI